MEFQNPSDDVPELRKTGRSTDFEALKTAKGLVGHALNFQRCPTMAHPPIAHGTPGRVQKMLCYACNGMWRKTWSANKFSDIDNPPQIHPTGHFAIFDPPNPSVIELIDKQIQGPKTAQGSVGLHVPILTSEN